MAAAAQEVPRFYQMSEVEVRQWVEANPERVNDRDSGGWTPLAAACRFLQNVSLIVWLLDEKGADVNATTETGNTPLHMAVSLEILIALLDRGADPTMADSDNWLPLIRRAANGVVKAVARLLQDPLVRATINLQDVGRTALHWACLCWNPDTAAPTVHLLLQAGANPTKINNDGEMPLGFLRQHRPSRHAVIALLEQTLADVEKTWLLVKARRIAVAATSSTVAPSCLQGRVAQERPLPRVALMPLTGGQDDGADEDVEGRKLRTTLAFMCGLGREAMPRDVFRTVMDLLMPSWDPLRRKNAGTEPSAVQQG